MREPSSPVFASRHRPTAERSSPQHVWRTESAHAKWDHVIPGAVEPGAVAVSSDVHRYGGSSNKNPKVQLAKRKSTSDPLPPITPPPRRPSNRTKRYASKTAKASCRTESSFLRSQEPPAVGGVLQSTGMSMARRLNGEENYSIPNRLDDPGEYFDVEEPPCSEVATLEQEEEHYPGAVSVSFSRGERQLCKGRLTMIPGHMGEVPELHETDTPEQAERGEAADDTLSGEHFHSSHEDHPHWFCSNHFKVVVGIVVIIAIVVGIALPLSTRSDSSGDTPDDHILDPEARREAVRTLVSLVSSSASLEQVGSPQNLAFEWIVTEDELSPLGSDELASDVETVTQRYVLAVFFYATQGDLSWITSRFWLDGQVDECEWQFLSCNELGHVSSIETFTTGNRIAGAFPREIGVLSSLGKLLSR